MPHQQQSQSDISRFIKGIENVHCVVNDEARLREYYSRLFGPPQHQDGSWSEFKIAGLDFAVTQGNKKKFVITFTVERLAELLPLLESKTSAGLRIQHGDYGDYVEICPDDGFCLHFFEHKKKCGPQQP